MNIYQKLRPWTEIEACEYSSVSVLLLVDLLTENPLHVLIVETRLILNAWS